MSGDSTPTDEQLLVGLQREAFEYFLHESNPANGLIADKTQSGWPASIAAVGLALSSYPVGVERGWLARDDAARRTLTTLRFFHDSPQGVGADATGYNGFYYHFLDMTSGRRAWKCELSTIDTALLLAGVLSAAQYFDRETEAEDALRKTADELYRRVNWRWAQNGGATVSHGWTSERGFMPYRWEGYDEALILYLLGLGSPTHPLTAESYQAWSSTFTWKTLYGREYLYAGPLFIHQLSHIWVDFRGLRDDSMRARGLDYFENSRRATYAQREYATRNPRGFAGYGADCWGITASDGPGPATEVVDGRERRFFDYRARGVPYGPDDGTLAPWAVVTSLPFAPEIVLPAVRQCEVLDLRVSNRYGFKSTYNPTYPCGSDHPHGWVSPWHFGLDQGPIILMIENYRTGLVWRLSRQCPYIVAGLRRAGFAGGWL